MRHAVVAFGWVLAWQLAMAASPAPAGAGAFDTVGGRYTDVGFLKNMELEAATLSLETASEGKRAGLRLSGAGALPELVVEFETAAEWRGFVDIWDAVRRSVERAESDVFTAPTAGGDTVFLWPGTAPAAIEIGISDEGEQMSLLFGLAGADVDAFDGDVRAVTAYFGE